MCAIVSLLPDWQHLRVGLRSLFFYGLGHLYTIDHRSFCMHGLRIVLLICLFWKLRDGWSNWWVSSVLRNSDCITQVVVGRYWYWWWVRDLFSFTANGAIIWYMYLEYWYSHLFRRFTSPGFRQHTLNIIQTHWHFKKDKANLLHPILKSLTQAKKVTFLVNVWAKRVPAPIVPHESMHIGITADTIISRARKKVTIDAKEREIAVMLGRYHLWISVPVSCWNAYAGCSCTNDHDSFAQIQCISVTTITTRRSLMKPWWSLPDLPTIWPD